MTDFTQHDLSSAPEKSRPLLEKAQKEMGMIPALYSVMAEAPGVLEAYQRLHELFLASSFDAAEKTVVWQAINVEHDCEYCVAVHTAVAGMMKVDPAITQALRDQQPLEDDRLELLRQTTLAIVRDRGRPDPAVVEHFLEAGFSRQQLLDIVLGVSQKILSNYVNHLADTPIDDAFKRHAWTKGIAGTDAAA